jgi:hypothetical protein
MAVDVDGASAVGETTASDVAATVAGSGGVGVASGLITAQALSNSRRKR